MPESKKKRLHHTPLMIELNSMYKELQLAIGNAKVFGKSLKPVLQPLERVVLFVAKVVEELEETKERVAWLETELSKTDSSKHRVIDE